jgi:hypothetical protein
MHFMNVPNDKKAGWKKKLAHELIEYWIIVAYLVFFFGAFAWYRRLILAQYQIVYLHYGVALLEAMVLAKVIIMGDALGLGRRLGDKPLIVPTLYKALAFSLFAGAFTVLEHTVSGLLHGQGLEGGAIALIDKGKYELLASCLVTFFTFIPFFAFKELGSTLGESKLRDLFFRRRTAV